MNNSLSMLKNYFTIAFRNFWKHKVFSLINVSGLAIGISAALVIYLLVQFEFSFENFRRDKERIYRVVSDMTFAGDVEFKNSGIAMPMPAAVRADMTGIELVTHFVTANDPKVTITFAGNQSPVVFRKQKDIIYADEYYFSMFDHEWLAGSKQTALKDPFQVVLTEARAKSYFGNLDAANIIGRQLTYDDSVTATISGIIKEPVSKATDFRFKEFISLATVMNSGLKEHFGGTEWNSVNSNSQMFVKLNKGIRPEQIHAQFPGFRSKYIKLKDGEKDDTKNSLQPLTDIHFNAAYDAFDGRLAHKPTLYGLLAVAAFLLLLGCINFINLTTAQSAQRAKEIGIRKTLGSAKREIVFQFLTETFLLTLVAAVLSIAITPWLLNIFHDFIPPEISFNSINQTHVWLFLLLLIIVMTVLSGIYPALVLTKFQPVSVMKNQVTGSSKGRKAWLRKSLTVTQFVIAQFLVIATLVVSKQISYSMNKELGYKKEAIVYFRTPWNFFSEKKDTRRFALVEKIRTMPAVEKISLGGAPPAHNGASSSTLKVNTGKKETEMMVEVMAANPEYFDIYNLKLVAGRYPAKSDTTKEYLVNESYAKALGFTNTSEVIGKTINRSKWNAPIVGVIKDFHTKSTHEIIKPLTYYSAEDNSYMIHLALKSQESSPGLWKATMEKVEKEFKALFPEDDFEYKFFDETIAAFYKKEQDIKRLLNWSAGLCIFISCLGLFGLVIYTTNTRTKEIGVRKVLGASVAQIVTLLSKDLVSLVLVAFIIAVPLAWAAMSNWLQDFAYRTSISWWVFAACGSSMLVIAVIVLGIRTIRAALANPVKSLRTE